MTPILGVTGKFLKQPVKCVQVVPAVLLFFVFGEIFLQKRVAVDTTALAPYSQSPLTGPIPRGDQAAASISRFANTPTLREAFDGDNVVHWDNLTGVAPKGLRTSIDTSDGDYVRFMRYGLSPLKNVCIRPNGTIVVVGLSESEFARSLEEAGEAMAKEWKEVYGCASGCRGVAFENETPENALWLTGNTTHIDPYLGNVMHNFGERVWTLLTGFRDEDKSERTFYLHRMSTWLERADENTSENTMMFQFALLSRMAPPGTIKFLQHNDGETRPLCFQSLTPAFGKGGRMSAKLGLENFAPALARYRRGAFQFFNLPNPKVSLPPRPLRVTLYGRGDTSRRRVTNIPEVAQYLRSSVQPPMVVTIVDELLEQGLYSQSLPEVVSLMTQTDVLVTAHGASTWATMFLPERSAVIEVCGPCGPGPWIEKTIVPALRLKYSARVRELWGERVASPLAGNTTECKGPWETPDYTIDIGKLGEEIQSLRVVDGPGARLPLHWLFDQISNSYVRRD